MLDLLRTSPVPVVVTAVGHRPEATPTLAIIRDEHRSLAAVLHSWLHLARRASCEDRLPDVIFLARV
jgi:hypothetical protein